MKVFNRTGGPVIVKAGFQSVFVDSSSAADKPWGSFVVGIEAPVYFGSDFAANA
jgi:hypothetical protein